MPSVTQGEITEDKVTTLEINYQTDFAKSSLLSLSFCRMSHMICLPCSRTVLSALLLLQVGLTSSDCHGYTGEGNELGLICYYRSLICSLF